LRTIVPVRTDESWTNWSFIKVPAGTSVTDQYKFTNLKQTTKLSSVDGRAYEIQADSQGGYYVSDGKKIHHTDKNGEVVLRDITYQILENGGRYYLLEVTPKPHTYEFVNAFGWNQVFVKENLPEKGMSFQADRSGRFITLLDELKYEISRDPATGKLELRQVTEDPEALVSETAPLQILDMYLDTPTGRDNRNQLISSLQVSDPTIDIDGNTHVKLDLLGSIYETIDYGDGTYSFSLEQALDADTLMEQQGIIDIAG